MAGYWDPRARGVARAGDPGWLFTGRHDLMRRLIAATRGAAGTVLVTGCAGSGKSAVLARLVTLSDSTFLARHREQVAQIPDDLRPAPGAVDAAVLATGKTADEVLAQICLALGVPYDPTVPTTEGVDAFRQWLAGRPAPVTLVVDAMDEATNPLDLLALLAQLDSRDVGQRRIRMLVGVRSPGGPDVLASTAESRGLPLADQAQQKLSATRIRVDESPWWHQEDLAGYAGEILLTTPDSPYGRDGGTAATATALAQVLAAHAGRSFLVTRLAAASLAHRPQPVDPADPRWLTTISDGVLGVFRDDLRTSVPEPQDRLRAVHLLRAVAFAYGRGLPWRQIWPAVANAVARDPERTYGDTDIAWLLGSRLGGYLINDREDDVTVYRLFHDTLRSTLRERWRELIGDGLSEREV